MNWVSVLLQLLSFRRTFIQSQMVMQNAKAAAEKGKRAALFGVACLMAAIFLIAGIIVGVIELGLEVDRGEFFRFSGLLGSAFVLIFLGVLVVAVASLVLKSPDAPEPEPAPVEPPEAELRRLGAQILVRFLSKLSGDEPSGQQAPREKPRSGRP